MSRTSTKKAPLEGLRAVIVASRRTYDKLAPQLAGLGAGVEIFPAMEIRPVSDHEALDRAIDRLEEFDWIVFTSGYGVEFFLNRWRARAAPMGKWAKTKVCAVGPATRAALEGAGIEVALVPKDHAAEGVVRALSSRHRGRSGLAGKSILLPRARVARDLIPRELGARGARTEIVVCYENVIADFDPSVAASLAGVPPDLLVFTSTSAVTQFVTLMEEPRACKVMGAATIAALGPITKSAVTELGLSVHILPRQNTADSLVKAIAAFYRKRARRK